MEAEWINWWDQLTHFDEVKRLLEGLFQLYGTGGLTLYEPPSISGQEAIEEMMANEDDAPFWKENEWPGHFLRYKVLQTAQELHAGQFSLEKYNKIHLIKGSFIWNIRFNPFGLRGGVIPFMSYENIRKILDDHGGMGMVVLNCIANYDQDGAFYEWHEEMKGGKSAYTLKREAEGRKTWNRKTAFMIIAAHNFYFEPSDFDVGVEDGWISSHFQEHARQSDGTERPPKPELILMNIPERCRLNSINFNSDPYEWAEDYDE